MSHKNIVLFSFLDSTSITTADGVEYLLNNMGYFCSNGIKALENPICLCELTLFDHAIIFNNSNDPQTREKLMFAIGLCVSSIGFEHTILITDPETNPLFGLSTPLFSEIKQIQIPNTNNTDNSLGLFNICKEIDTYIKNNSAKTMQSFMNSPIDAAEKYVDNVICRLLEHVDEGIRIGFKSGMERIVINPRLMHLHINLCHEDNLDKQMDFHYSHKKLMDGFVPNARDGAAKFTCYFEDFHLHFVLYPDVFTVSYDTACEVLNMKFEDRLDNYSYGRFLGKESACFASALQSLLNENFVRKIVEEHYDSCDDKELEQMVQNILTVLDNGVEIINHDI